MERHEQRRHEAHQLAEIEREIQNADAADAVRDAILLRAMVAIGKITFARFDNTDEQLDRIELALKGINERLDKIMTELEDAQAAVARVEADVANVLTVIGDARTQISDLQQQIADLQASAGDVAALKAGLVDIGTRLTAVDDTLDTATGTPNA